MKWKAIAIEIISYMFILLFVYAAISKLLDVEKFRVQIGQSPLLTNFAGYVAWMIPSIEIAISLMLVFPKSKLIGLYASFSLMLAFTGYIIAITQFSEFVPCSCGGVLEKLGWTEHLIFNVGFVMFGLAGVILQSKNQKGYEENPKSIITA